MPASFLLITEDSTLLNDWSRQLPDSQLALRWAGEKPAEILKPSSPTAVIMDAILAADYLESFPPGVPLVIVGEPRSQPYESARIAKVANLYFSYEESRGGLTNYLPLLADLAEARAALQFVKAPQIESSPPFSQTSPSPPDMWDYFQGLLENLGSQDRLLNEFRRTARKLLGSSHVVFFLKERGGFRADRGESYCPDTDPMIKYLGQHPTVLDGVNWTGPVDPVSQLAVTHWMSLWSARLLVPIHDNGSLSALVAFGVREDGKPFGPEDHTKGVLVARLFRILMSLATDLGILRHDAEHNRLKDKYGPTTAILGPNESPGTDIPLIVRSVIGEVVETGRVARKFPRKDQPFRAAAGPIAETGGIWSSWEEVSAEFFEAEVKGRSARVELLRDLAITLSHEVGNALVSLSVLSRVKDPSKITGKILGVAKENVAHLEKLNSSLVDLSNFPAVSPADTDLCAILKRLGKKHEIDFVSSADTVVLPVAADLLEFSLDQILESICENRGQDKLAGIAMELRSTGTGVDCTAMISIKGENIELEGVLSPSVTEETPTLGRMGVFFAREVIRMHDGEIHAGPGLQGTEILLSIKSWT